MSFFPADGQGWRLMGEFAQPPESLNEQWLVDGLTAALKGIDGLSPDVDRVKNATLAAVKRLGSCRATLASGGQPLVVRVLISAASGDWVRSPAWGFFVVEHTTGEVASNASVSDWQAGHPTHQRIELYVYHDAGHI